MQSDRPRSTPRPALLFVIGLLALPSPVRAQAPAWVQLSPPAERTLHVRDSRRDREIFFDQSGLVVLDDAATDHWSRIFLGSDPVIVPGSAYAFYDFARDRIWALTLPTSNSMQLWSFDLGDLSPVWTSQAWAWANPAFADTVIQAPSLVFDPAHDRLLVFGGFVSLQSCVAHCVPPGDSNRLLQLQLGGTPTWSSVPVQGTPPSGRQLACAVYDPWRDRALFYGGVSFGPVLYDETWSLSLAAPMSWTLLNPTTLPPFGRVVDSAVLDSLGRRWVLHGIQSGAGGGPPTYALDLSNSVNAGDASWSQVAPTAGTVASYPAVSFVQPGQDRLVVMDGTSEWRLPLAAPTDWQLVPGGPLRQSDVVGFVDPATQRMYAGFGSPDGRLQWRPLSQDIPWSDYVPATAGPGERPGAVAGMDPLGNKVWVFGGRDVGNAAESSELWSLDLASSQWTLVSPGNPPLPRSEALGIFDPVHRRFIVHGGRYQNPNPTVLGDTWVLNASTGAWSSPATGNYGLHYGEVGIYDPSRDRVLAFGGRDASGVKDTTVHVLPLGATVGTWSTLATTGTPPDWSDEEVLAAVYDPEGDRMLVTGGTTTTTVWELGFQSTPAWQQLTLNGPAPPFRYGTALAYDAANHRMIRFGGHGVVGDPPGSDMGDLWAVVFPPGVVATELALFSVDATPDRVTLRWYGSLSTGLGTVQRRDAGASWHRLGETSANGVGHWIWTDTDVVPGASYDYRLSVQRNGTEQFFGETHVDVPVRSEFALAGIRPNPSAGVFDVAFSLPGTAPATLELLDVSGRRVLSRDVGALGAGTHQLRLDSGREPPAPGLYFVRLRSGGAMRLAKAVVTR